jgi:GT2 family glycosyltransferase
MMSSDSVDLTISIVSFNTRAFLHRCLDSIYRNTNGITFEVIVVDNASRDQSPEMVRKGFPRVRLIANAENRFFTRAHNQALEIAQGKYFLILGSDTEIPPGTLKGLVRFLDAQPDVGAVGCREIWPDGTVERIGSLFSTPQMEIIESTQLHSVAWVRPFVNRYRIVDWDRDTSREVDVLTDCFLMVRKELLQRISGYDEQFLLYYTENDLCLRIWQSGYRVFLNADYIYVHHRHQSTKQEGQTYIRKIYAQDRLRYYRKHFGVTGMILVKTGIPLVNSIMPWAVTLYHFPTKLWRALVGKLR